MLNCLVFIVAIGVLTYTEVTGEKSASKRDTLGLEVLIILAWIFLFFTEILFLEPLMLWKPFVEELNGLYDNEDQNSLNS